ncbi:unnamed protein product [Orchesella dallaii]|uniref:Uncharacterized protein n=1 Tax=Orchesella dallaii TaxID=48710 RepID=A0ABP1QYE4_9HEXA
MKPQFGVLNSLLLFLQGKHKTLTELSVEIRELRDLARECKEKFELLRKDYDYPGAEVRACVLEIFAMKTKYFAFKEKVTGIYDNQHAAYNFLLELKRKCGENASEFQLDMSLALAMDASIARARDTDVIRVYAEWTALSLIPKLRVGIANMDELIADETRHNSVD